MAAQSKAPHDHFTLLVGQFGKPLIDALREIVILQQFTGIGRSVVGQCIQQSLIGVRPKGNVHRSHPLVETEHALDLINRLFQQVGDFFR
ncbi:hypothetical protein D3C85_665380 [compost metagenome]